MRTKTIAGLMCVGAAMLVASSALAQKPRWLTVENKLRLGYDDNVNYTDKDKTESFRITEELALTGEARMENTFLSLRYKAGATWYDDRGGKNSETDWTHAVDFIWNQTLSRRFSLGVVDRFLYLDRPELVNPDGTIRNYDASYYYNSVNATLASILTTQSRLDLSARHKMLRYDKDIYGNTDNYDAVSAGATLRGQLAKETSGFLDLRYENLDYPEAGKAVGDPVYLPGSDVPSQPTVPDRGSDSYATGVGVEHTFSPNLIGLARAGYTFKDYSAANTSSDSAPYGEANITVIPVPSTRVTLGAAYSLYQSGISTYANQTRTAATAKIGHDLTAKIGLSVAGTYVNSQYEAKDSIKTLSEGAVHDGSEDALTVAARVTFRVNRNNWLEAGWRFTDLSTDLRSDYQRNVYDVAWRVRL